MIHTQEQIEHNRQVWFDGLRSGRYIKNNSRLFSRTNPRKCCVIGIGMRELGIGDFSGFFAAIGIHPHKKHFPSALENTRPKKANLYSGSIYYVDQLNDNTCYTLAQQADILEKQFNEGNVNECSGK